MCVCVCVMSGREGGKLGGDGNEVSGGGVRGK